MPTYVCAAAVGRLTPVQKTEIVRRITAIHHEETGAPRYLVQVIFYDVTPDSHYVAGRLAPADQIWVRADIRSGRTNEQKNQMLRRIMQDVLAGLASPVDWSINWLGHRWISSRFCHGLCTKVQRSETKTISRNTSAQ